MRKLVLGTSIAALVGLAGCSGETIEDLQTQATPARPASRIMFDPSNGVLPVPTDLLFALAGQTQDGTLETPDEVASRAANNGMADYSDPSIALGAQDGWSTQAAFAISTSHPAGVTLDAASVGTPGSVRIFRGAIGGDLKDPDCSAAPPLTGCKIYEELTYGVDFAAQPSGNNINIIPLKAFAGATSYYVVLTTGLKASDGEALKGSTTYNLVRQPISTMPLATASQLALQGLVNSYEAVIVTQGAVDADSIIYSSTFTTQTTHDIFNTIKGLQISGFAQAFGAALAENGGDQSAAAATSGAQLPVILVDATTPQSAYEVVAPIFLGAQTFGGLQAVGLGTCAGLTAAATNPASPLNDTAAPLFAQFGVLCSAQVSQGTIDLPYYLSTTEPLTDSWQAACTNGLALRGIGAEGIGGLIAAGAVGPANALCQAASGGSLFDLDISSLPIIDERHLTRYSPIPLPKGSNADGSETLSVQISVPDLNFITTLAAINPAVSVPTKPAAGWPVVILSHGITGVKEQMLVLSGALSLAGFATVAIDQPLHGERGFVLADNTVINASGGMGGSTTHYFNLASLLSTRDNIRQGIADIIGLRLGLNAFVDVSNTIDLDISSVYLAGQSLGSINGHTAVAMANESLAQVSPELAAFDPMYAFKGVGLSVPGGGLAGFLLESGSFGNLVKGSVLAGGNADFQQFLGQYMAANGLTDVAAALIPAYIEYVASATEEQQATAAALFAQFNFAAQTILDAGDPNTYAATLGAQDTPVYLAEVVGGGTNDDGSTGLPDQTIPNFVPPLSGTTPLARLIGLPLVGSTTQGNGHVRFNAGGHASLLVPVPSAATTVEMQSQLATFFATAQLGAPTVVITNTSVVVN